MSENTAEVVVGAAVLALAAGFLIYAGQVTGFSGSTSKDYDLRASFRSAEGISVGTDVRLAGVRIGSVTGLDLNPTTFRADATFTLSQGVEIPDDSGIAISSEGLLGGNFVEILPGASDFSFEPGAEIEDTQGSVSLISLLLKFVSGRDE